MKKAFLLALILSLAPAYAGTISLSSTLAVQPGSSFDIAVVVTDVFADRANDFLTGYGFNVTIGDPGIFRYDGETAGPLFDDFSAVYSGNPQVAGLSTDPGGIGAGTAGYTDPLTLAVLHFTSLTTGTTTIGVAYNAAQPTTDGLFYFNTPTPEAISASTTVSSATPEPATFALMALAIAITRVAGIAAHRLS